MKAAFVLYGLGWLAVAGAFAKGAPWSWGAMVAAAAGVLWYAPFGTLAGIMQLVLLIRVRQRNPSG